MGTMVIDTEKTFSAVLLMSCGPKTKFGSQEQDVSAAGEKKWAAECAVTFHAEYGMRPQSEVIAVTVTAGTDPGASIAPGTAVELVNLRVGFQVPERGQNDRIKGGRPYWMATGLRPAAGSLRPVKTAEAS